MDIKKIILFSLLWLLMVIILLTACNPFQSEIDPNSNQSASATPAQNLDAPSGTLSPIPAATLIPTLGPTATLRDSIVMAGLPESPGAYVYYAGLINVALNGDDLDKAIEVLLNLSPVIECPDIWVETFDDEQVPTYRLYINAAEEDQEYGFYVIIRPINSDIERDGIVGFGSITPDFDNKFAVIIEYQPSDGEPMPDEFEIQLVFSGCKIYTAIVSWP